MKTRKEEKRAAMSGVTKMNKTAGEPTGQVAAEASSPGRSEGQPGTQQEHGGKKMGAKRCSLFEEVEPWGEAVNGEELLDELERELKRFVVLPKHAAPMLALWVVHTYAFGLRDVGSYLGIESPEKRCGKTTLLTVLSELAHRAILAASISPPALFRVIDEWAPTLLIDEADTVLHGNEKLRGILHAGYTRKAARVVRIGRQAGEGKGPGWGPARYSCWCPKAMAAIGYLPNTLADRCIVIRMQRRRADERTERLRELRGETLQRKCARFVADHREQIARGWPTIPAGLNDRAGDVWEPLLALADEAGGKWPERARQAAVGLSRSAVEHSPTGALLMDIFLAFFALETERVFSRTLVRELNGFTDRPWQAGLKGVTELWLAAQLRQYGIRPTTIRLGEEVGKGYAKADFMDAFKRYIPASEIETMRPRGEGE